MVWRVTFKKYQLYTMMKNRFEASTPFKTLYWRRAFVFLTLLCQLTLIVVVQLLCATLCNVMDCSTPGSFNCLILIKWDLIVYLQKEYTYTNKFSVYLKEVFMFYCKSLHWSVLPVPIFIMIIYKISLFTSLPRGTVVPDTVIIISVFITLILICPCICVSCEHFYSQFHNSCFNR